jgi:hypothetical protein
MKKRWTRHVLALGGLCVSLATGCGGSKQEQAEVGAEDAGTERACGSQESTFAALQRSIFDAHGCSAHSCHGAHDPQAGLTLTADTAFESLVNVPASAAGLGRQPLLRVRPGRRAESLLYLKLAALTHAQALPDGTGAPMPAGGAGPVPAEKLEALALWILAGAPREGVVKGTATLLGCELPEATPQHAIPPLPPPTQEGYQLYAPGWPLAAGGEDEVCFVTYYDLTESAPADARLDCPEDWGAKGRECVAYRDSLLTQDPQSHHGNVHAYLGSAEPTDPGWGSWTCLGGELAGVACDPTRLGVSAREGGAECGELARCTSQVRSAPACVGYGPADASNRREIGGAQGLNANVVYPEGVYGVIPAKGMIMWNSHGFNLTSRDTTVSLYLNMHYALSAQRRYVYRPIFDDAEVLSVQVGAFERREMCRTLTLPRATRLHHLIGHMHKRGVLFRIWDEPHAPCRVDDPSCVPLSSAPIYASTRYDDQTVLLYDPPRAFDQENPDERTLLYCVTYDNGYTNPETVKRKSTSPKVPGGRAPGGPCADSALVCLGGDRQGTACGGDAAVCSGGGVCDACPLRGGVTTEDEMIILLGGYYVVD